jgi:predicted nuclease of predicted toxin-antitoxin system
VRFLVDAQLPPGLARWIEAQGYEAKAVREVGLREAADSVIWEYAEQGGWVVVTKDDDFANRAMGQGLGPSVVWLRIGNCINRVLLAWLASLFPEVLSELAAGQRLVEVAHEEPPSGA